MVKNKGCKQKAVLNLKLKAANMALVIPHVKHGTPVDFKNKQGIFNNLAAHITNRRLDKIIIFILIFFLIMLFK